MYYEKINKQTIDCAGNLMSSEDIKSRMQRLSLLIHYYTFIDLASICSPSSIPELEITRIPAKKKKKKK